MKRNFGYVLYFHRIAESLQPTLFKNVCVSKWYLFQKRFFFRWKSVKKFGIIWKILVCCVLNQYFLGPLIFDNIVVVIDNIHIEHYCEKLRKDIHLMKGENNTSPFSDIFGFIFLFFFFFFQNIYFWLCFGA